MRRLAGLLVLVVLARTASAQDAFELRRAADLAGMIDVDPILLTLTEGKTTYHIGERIPLRLEFSPIGQVGLLRTDCGPGISLDVALDGPHGVFVPRRERDFVHRDVPCGVIGGVWGGRRMERPGLFGLDGLLLSPAPPPPPVHEEVDLNTAVRISAPGRYRFYMRTRFATPQLHGTPPRLSNIVTIDVLERDPAWEASVLARATRQLDAPEPRSAPEALADLALLGSEAAVDLLSARRDGSILALAWSARNRAHVVRRMTERLDDLSRPVDHAYVAILSAVEADRLAREQAPSTTEFERLQREYSARRLRALAAAGQLDAHLTAAMRQASDRGRAYPHPRIAWQSLPAGFAAVPGPVESALSGLTPALQRFVLEDRLGWREFADPTFLPMFRRLAASRAPDGPQDVAMAMWFVLAPDDARAFAWRELASSGTPLSAAGLLALPAAPLPQFDSAMVRRLEAAAGPTDFDRAMSVIERFGSARIRHRVARAFERQEFAARCPQSATTLAYFFRVAPSYARALLTRVDAALSAVYDECEPHGLIATMARRRMSPALEAAAVTRLADPRPWVVEDAAEMLRAYGSTAAEAALWLAFEQWRDKAPRLAESASSDGATEDVDAAYRVERAFSRALVGGTRWHFDAAAEVRRRSLCISDDCRSGRQTDTFGVGPPTVYVTAPAFPQSEPRVFAGEIVFDRVADVLAQVAVWPAATVWTWRQDDADPVEPWRRPTSLWLPGQEEALFEAIRRVIVAGGMTMRRD